MVQDEADDHEDAVQQHYGQPDVAHKFVSVEVGAQNSEGTEMEHEGEERQRDGNLEGKHRDIADLGVEGDQDRQAGDELLVAEGEDEAFKDVDVRRVADGCG